MRILIGILLIILSGVLCSTTGIMLFLIPLFVGVFLFMAFPVADAFCDYIIMDSNVTLVRKRHYFNFLPFYIVYTVLTLGQGTFLIPWKEEYFKVTVSDGKAEDITPITHKAYRALRLEQRQLYSTKTPSRAFMEANYDLNNIRFARKRNRLIVVSVLAALTLTGFTEIGAWPIMLIYEAIFLTAILLWIPDYKDAKVLQQAYDRAIAAEPQEQ